jgi:ornithine cyclodeaminase/alanine dehydrogenase-like protein (mu-crystallin family)
MRLVSAAEIDRLLDYPSLIEALRTAFSGGIAVPLRHHHAIRRQAAEASVILMPAWHEDDGFLGVKIVSVFPGNQAKGKPSVMGTYLLLDGETGEPLASFDGVALTLWRTAAASALAARYLARPDAQIHAMIGAGALAPRLIAAHAAARPVRETFVWNRTPAKAEALARALDRPDLPVRAVGDIAEAVRRADIVSAATMTREPLIHGDWLKPGSHVDLVGAYLPTMREADDAAISRASVYVDTRAGALKEAGDIVQAIAGGVLREETIHDLFDLVAGKARGRRSSDEITLFKSVGTAIEDLAAATLVYRRLPRA